MMETNTTSGYEKNVLQLYSLIPESARLKVTDKLFEIIIESLVEENIIS